MSDKRANSRGCWFVGTTKCPADVESIKNNINEFHYWAYITHRPDDDDERLHLHYVVLCNGTRTLKSVSETLGADMQYMQVCKRPRGAIRYLIHLDNPEKEQYTIEDIVTNDITFTKTYLTDNNAVTAKDLYNDLSLIQTGRLQPDQFVEKYAYHLDKLPFYQRIKTMEVIARLRKF